MIHYKKERIEPIEDELLYKTLCGLIVPFVQIRWLSNYNKDSICDACLLLKALS